MVMASLTMTPSCPSKQLSNVRGRKGVGRWQRDTMTHHGLSCRMNDRTGGGGGGQQVPCSSSFELVLLYNRGHCGRCQLWAMSASTWDSVDIPAMSTHVPQQWSIPIAIPAGHPP